MSTSLNYLWTIKTGRRFWRMKLTWNLAAPGLIIRKGKQVHESEASDDSHQLSTSSSTGAGLLAEDAVALLLKHNRGYYASEDDKSSESQDTSQGKQQSKGKKPKKEYLVRRDLHFLIVHDSTETWVPPEGQSGDGRTSLKDRYGY
ncbi:hypothetical protein RchiOBHm_Chr2g0164301 [Rosa chinensis]|uniref:Uncharacterized protein n=1 Tax=Rosa chinensis TaxID=74649 RepID=A0A2P6S3I2_ROSCH|nr:hypothetical protein RchiOBHm_Chr2g0164301 [Rosa chinensis]